MSTEKNDTYIWFVHLALPFFQPVFGEYFTNLLHFEVFVVKVALCHNTRYSIHQAWRIRKTFAGVWKDLERFPIWANSPNPLPTLQRECRNPCKTKPSKSRLLLEDTKIRALSPLKNSMGCVVTSKHFSIFPNLTY